MFSQVDYEGHHYQLLAEVRYHNRDDIKNTKMNGFIKYRNWNIYRKRTTHILKLLKEQMDNSVHWVPLNDLKQSNPVKLGEYGVANNINDEHAFI